MEDTLAQKPLKTYSKIDNIAPKTTLNRRYKPRITIIVKREPLTTKKAIELLLNGTLKRQVCRYCMNVTNVLNDLDQIMHISRKDALYKVCIRDMVATFHPFKAVDDPNFPNKICEKCLTETTRLYLFAQQCERSERAIRNCFDDMYEKLEKLDPLERTKKRGRQKQNPNQNTLHTEHKYVIDYADPIHYLINSGTVPLTNEPMMTELECKRCWQVLPNVESLVNHEMTHPKTMWYNCRLCGKSFSKKFHLKKHLRSHNKNLEVISESEKAFECKTCGCISDDYQTHLQHIEKHKFGRVLQQLLKRKMDSLCSVCLDNRSQMTDLDKTICLHGGYPELTGERSVFNILGASVPELKQKYKYQDLCIPYQANIMTITKKDKDEKLYSKQEYIISAPTVLSTEKKEYGESYLFIFAEPLINLAGAIMHDDFEVNNELISINSNGQSAGTCDNTNNQSDIDRNGHKLGNISIDIDTPNEKEKQIYLADAKENIKFAFSMPDYVLDINKSNNSLIETKINKVKQCKVCWIFKKPTCKDCVTINNGENKLKLYNRSDICQSKTSDNCTEKQPCKSCWIFKDKNCDICNSSRQAEKSISKVLITAHNESEVLGKQLKLKSSGNYEENRIFADKTGPNVIIEKDNKSMKRKIAEDTYKMPAKKAKWQCNICLTENKTNRETCICCENYILHTKTSVSKFNWRHNEIFDLYFGQNVVKNVSAFTGDNDDDNVNIVSERSGLEITKVELEVNVAKGVNITQDLSLPMYKEINEQLQTNIYEKLPVEEDMEFTESIVTTIDIARQTFDQKYDFNFSNLSFDDANMDSEDISKALPLTLQFNIGKGPQDEKKNLRQFKKPLRRTSQK